MSDPMEAIRQTFFAECQELLESLIDALGHLADGKADTDGEAIAAAFRAVHSIKGGASAFGMVALVEFSHDFETALDICREAPARLTPDVASLFLKCGDILGALVAHETSGEDVNETRRATIHDDLTAMIEGLTGPTPKTHDDAMPEREARWHVRLSPDAAFYRSGHELTDVVRALSDMGDIETEAVLNEEQLNLDALPGLLSIDVTITGDITNDRLEETLGTFDLVSEVTNPDATHPDTGPRSSAAPLAHRKTHTVRVDLERIDRLVNLVGELVINQAMLTKSVETTLAHDLSVVDARLTEYQQLTRSIQDSVISIRAQPIKPLFNRMTATIREAADELGKRVRVEIIGATEEFDTTAIERLAEPLTHLVRNAVDHGLERAEEREAIGKPPEGLVTLSARQSGDQIEISVADDGRGIDRAAVLKKAKARGLVPRNAALSDRETDHLLFLPGFTTRDQVSEYSGRGVGMDVVSAQIAELGGRASITSSPGFGTEVTLTLPLTLALLDGMVVRVEDEPIVLPMTSIQETLTLSETCVFRMVDGALALRLHDAFYPLIDLGDVLGYRKTPERFDGKSAVVITPEQCAPLAYCVDDVEDRRQVVIKRFDTGFGAAPGLSAATILGDGEVALILDPSRFGPSASVTAPLETAQ